MLSRPRTQKGFYTSLKIFSYICTAIALFALLGLVINILVQGTGHITLQLLFGEYGLQPSILPAFVGTIRLIVIALALALPLGIGSAIFLVEYASSQSKIVRIIRVTTETLAGIPSIVYGLFGYLIFVVAFGWGYSLLGGGLTLGLMILPTIVRSVEEALIAVPSDLRAGAYALGASKVRTIFRVVIPRASSGIVTAVILSIGRVVSESAVLILTIGMVVNKMPDHLLSPGTSLALDIYYFASYGYQNEAAATSVVLLVLVVIINLAATAVGRLIKKRMGE